jgi:hypothetical protein
MIPVVTLIALQIPGIFAGAIITEQIFRINGIGFLAHQLDQPEQRAHGADPDLHVRLF